MYPDVIIGSQKSSHNLNMKGTKGRGIRHVIYWKHPNTEPGSQPMKVNLILYENDILQVTGSSFYLWVLDCYPAILKLVDFIIQEANSKCHNEFCECGGGGVKRLDDALETTVASKASCGSMQLKTILEYLENIEDDLGTLTERVEDLTHAHQVHKGHCKDEHEEAQEKLSSMHSKIGEIRQLVGVTALSKGVASFKVLNEMKRQSVVDAHGFMIPLSDLKKIQEKFSENNGNGLKESPHLENTEDPAPEERKRSGSPKKSKREKSPTKPQKQKWESRDEARKAKVALNRQQTEEREGKAGAEGWDEEGAATVERPRAARTRSRSKSPNKRSSAGRSESPRKKTWERDGSPLKRFSLERSLTITETEEEQEERNFSSQALPATSAQDTIPCA